MFNLASLFYRRHRNELVDQAVDRLFFVSRVEVNRVEVALFVDVNHGLEL